MLSESQGMTSSVIVSWQHNRSSNTDHASYGMRLVPLTQTGRLLSHCLPADSSEVAVAANPNRSRSCVTHADRQDVMLQGAA